MKSILGYTVVTFVWIVIFSQDTTTVMQADSLRKKQDSVLVLKQIYQQSVDSYHLEAKRIDTILDSIRTIKKKSRIKIFFHL